MVQLNQGHKTHVLDFGYDEQDCCALLVLVNDVRFHIIADPKDLQKSREKRLYYEYLEKIFGLRDAEQQEKEATKGQQLVGKGEKKKRSQDNDSAVDMSADEDSDQDQDSGSAAVELRNWIISAFGNVIGDLQIKSGELEPQLLEMTDELNASIEKLIPRLKMPKYIQCIDLPWIDANDLIVQSEVSLPEPAHPGKVSDKNGNIYFFKPVVPDEPGPVKREISILRKLAELDLDIKVPQLLGFVSFNNSKTEITGFLLSNIDSPQPLTNLLKSSVPCEKRAEWASRSEDYVKTLHHNNIIWGDAKADNFLVDANDVLCGLFISVAVIPMAGLIRN